MTATTGTWKALRAALAVNKAGGSTIPIRPESVSDDWFGIEKWKCMCTNLFGHIKTNNLHPIKIKSRKTIKGPGHKEEWGYVIAIDSTGYKTRIVLHRFWWIPSLQAQAADSLSQKSHFRPQAPIPGRALPPAWWHRPPRRDPLTCPHLLCRHRPDQAQPQRLLRQTNAGTFNLQTYFSSGLWKCPEQTATYFKDINKVKPVKQQS